MKRFLFSMILLITFSTFAFSQSNAPKKFEILACSPKLTEAGRQSSFRFGYKYVVATDEDGTVKNVNYVKSEYDPEHLADSSEVIPCIEKMKLSSSSRYVIYISFGTTSDEDFIRISNKSVQFKIIL